MLGFSFSLLEEGSDTKQDLVWTGCMMMGVDGMYGDGGGCV